MTESKRAALALSVATTTARQPLRVALANPFCWPWVRRGSERMLQLMSSGLAARGHRVTVYASAPVAGTEQRGVVQYRLLRQRHLLRKRQLGLCHAYAWELIDALRWAEADTVWCLSYFDAWAAVRARELGARHRVVFHTMGIPTRSYFRSVPLDAWFMRRALAGADTVLTLSCFASDSLRRGFGVNAQVLPGLVDASAFVTPATAGSSGPGTLLFVGDLDEPRKGAALVCRAFVALQNQRPGLRLQLSGAASPATRKRLLSLPGMGPLTHAVDFLGLGRVEDLPALYAAARVTILPAVWEAFGLVLLESLAAGTPVVGARHAGIPDIVTGDPALGALFDPESGASDDAVVDPHHVGLQAANLVGLIQAIARVLDRPHTDTDRGVCRARARACTWEALAPRYEALLTGAQDSP